MTSCMIGNAYFEADPFPITLYLEKREGPEPEEREEEVQGREIRCRVLARRDPTRGGPAWLDAGRPHRAHHRRRPDV